MWPLSRMLRCVPKIRLAPLGSFRTSGDVYWRGFPPIGLVSSVSNASTVRAIESGPVVVAEAFEVYGSSSCYFGGVSEVRQNLGCAVFAAHRWEVGCWRCVNGIDSSGPGGHRQQPCFVAYSGALQGIFDPESVSSSFVWVSDHRRRVSFGDRRNVRGADAGYATTDQSNRPAV